VQFLRTLHGPLCPGRAADTKTSKTTRPKLGAAFTNPRGGRPPDRPVLEKGSSRVLGRAHSEDGVESALQSIDLGCIPLGRRVINSA